MSQAATDANGNFCRLEETRKALEHENQTLVAANKGLVEDAEITKGSLLENQLLTNIMDKMVSTIPKEDSNIFQLDKCLENKSMSTRELLNAASQVLMCCNATMMKNRVEGGEHQKSVAKRARSKSPSSGPAPSALQQAIAKEWSL